jgi:hypothetical protein
MRKDYLRNFRGLFGMVALLLLLGMASTALAANLFEGFETSGLFDFGNGVVHTSPGGPSIETDYAEGINASSGNFLARLSVQPTANVDDNGNAACAPGSKDCVGPFTNWGLAYDVDTGVPMKSGGSVTSVDIYLDVNFAAAHSDYRFDWDSALLDSQGNFLQDYIFNVGTGNPSQPVACAPASGGYFVISASNNSQRENAYPQNPGRMPQCIATSGWYTFEHVFKPLNNDLGVHMEILNAQKVEVAIWTMHPTCMGTQVTNHLCTNAALLPFSAVGANAYGWFDDQEIDSLAIDNLSLTQE